MAGARSPGRRIFRGAPPRRDGGGRGPPRPGRRRSRPSGLACGRSHLRRGDGARRARGAHRAVLSHGHPGRPARARRGTGGGGGLRGQVLEAERVRQPPRDRCGGPPDGARRALRRGAGQRRPGDPGRDGHRSPRPAPFLLVVDDGARHAHLAGAVGRGMGGDRRGLFARPSDRRLPDRPDSRALARRYPRRRSGRGHRRDHPPRRPPRRKGRGGDQGGGDRARLPLRCTHRGADHPRGHGGVRRHRARGGRRQDAPRRSGGGAQNGRAGGHRPGRRVTAARHRLIMMSAGEASGDLHGATVCRAIKRLDPQVRVLGMGGARMAAAGVEILVDPTAHAGVGTNEVIGRIPSLFRAYRLLVRRLRRERPQALVVVDFPEFNLRLARHAKRARVPVVYFMPPQLWAWRSGRIRQMASRVTQVLAAFPFERDLYEDAHIPVEYVGHPLLDVVPFTLSPEEGRRRLGLPKEGTVVGLLPGSRREEIEHLLAPTVSRGVVESFIRGAAGAPPIELVEGQTHEVMAAADVLLFANGTATTEAALLGTPMVVCYRVSRLTEMVGRLLKQIPWISLPNIVARRTAVPEILQADVTGARLAAEAKRLLEDHDAAADQRLAFKDLRERLGEPGVGERAARAILKIAGAA